MTITLIPVKETHPVKPCQAGTPGSGGMRPRELTSTELIAVAGGRVVTPPAVLGTNDDSI